MFGSIYDTTSSSPPTPNPIQPILYRCKVRPVMTTSTPLVNSKTLMMVHRFTATPLDVRVGAPHQCPFGSVASYHMYVNVRLHIPMTTNNDVITMTHHCDVIRPLLVCWSQNMPRAACFAWKRERRCKMVGGNESRLPQVRQLWIGRCLPNGASTPPQRHAGGTQTEQKREDTDGSPPTVPPHTISVSEGSHSVIQFFADMRHTNASS